MSPDSYSEEQRKDIEERVAKAKTFLEELHLQPGCLITPENIGNNNFVLKATAYLQDTKYSSVVSPIQK